MLYQQKLPIESNSEVNPGIHLLWIDAPDIAAVAQPGQFVMLTCDDGKERLLRRPISIHQVKRSKIAFLFAAVGRGTVWLSHQAANTKIDLLGPLGNGFQIDPRSRKLLLLAGGLGIAPLVFLAELAIKSGYNLRILVGAKTQSLLYDLSDLLPAAEIHLVTEDGSCGRKGLVTAMLPEHALWADQIFLCGPLPMYKALQKTYAPCFEGKTAQVSLEVRMGCGLGFCYACTIKTRQGLKQVCHDGPVFNFADVVWEEL
jgi:dihydroorotate dehydrogenase electron transfer subunit